MAVARLVAVPTARSAAPTVKLSGEMPDSTFEQSLSTLARNVLQDRAPRLFEHEVGFQLLEKSDDGDKAVGVFGFQVGPEVLYAPVIFRNGAIKGTELLWVKSLGQFIPLTEGWVNAYLRQKPSVLGSGIDKDRSRDGTGYPDLIPLIRSPFKMAGAFRVDLVGSMANAFSALAKAADLRAVVDRTPAFSGTLRRWLDEYPTYKMAFNSFYPGVSLPPAPPPAGPTSPVLGAAPGPVDRPGPAVPAPAPIGSRLAQAMAPQLAGGMTAPPAARSPVLGVGTAGGAAGNGTTQTKAKATSSADLAKIAFVNVVTRTQVVGRLIPLEGVNKDDVVANGYTASDGRGDSSMTVPVSYRTALTNPSRTGRYGVLQPDGRFEDRLVVFTDNRRRPTCVVLDVSPSGAVKAHGSARPGDVWVQQVDESGTPTALAKGLAGDIAGFPDASAKKPNWRATYLLVGPDGRGFGPFEVFEDLTGPDGPTTLEVRLRQSPSVGGSESPVSFGCNGIDNDMLWYVDGANPHFGYGTNGERMPGRQGWSGDQHTLVLTGKPGSRLVHDRNAVLVPNTYKMLALEPADPDADYEHADTKNTITLGRPEDLQGLLYRKSAALTVDRRDGLYRVNASDPLEFGDAVRELMVGWDLREDNALALLKEADRQPAKVLAVPCERVYELAEEYARDLLLKRADGPPTSYNVGSSIGAPDFPDFPIEFREQTLSGSVPANAPTQVTLPVDPAVIDQYRNGVSRDPYAAPEGQILGRALQAARSGVKEVFDVGSLTSLMKRHGNDVLIDDNLPPLMTALGSLGTLLFNLYYSSDEFEDRYGKNDMGELEGVLRSAFKTTGEALLYLKQKSVRAFPGDYGIDFSESTPSK